MTGPADNPDLAKLGAHVRAPVPAVADLELSRGTAGGVRVSMLRIAHGERGNGHGEAALTLITEWADQHGVLLVGTPEPAHLDGERRVTATRLRRWYSRHGFRRNHTGRNPEYRDAMVREPRIPPPRTPSER